MVLAAAAQTSTFLAAMFLPVLTVVSGLMGLSVCKTHRDEIDFDQPNILWTCVIAPPGKLERKD